MITPQYIRAARDRLGMTQTQLADALGVDRRTLAGWERGDRTLAERGRMLELALAELARRAEE